MILFALLASLSAPFPGPLKTFRDWTVGCDNGRACHATSLMPEDGQWDEALAMNVKRDAEPGAPVRIAVIAAGATVGSLVADGKPLAAKLTQGDEETQVDEAGSAAVVEAKRSASAIAIVDSQGKELGKVSLAGLSAALLYIDEAQRRVGTSTALVRRGSRPASAVPPAPPLPVIRSAAANGSAIEVSPARIAQLRKQAECMIDQVGGPDSAEIEVLDEGHSLLLLSCGAGAYNFSAIPYVVTRKGKALVLTIASFDLKPGWSEGGVAMLVNGSWDPKQGLLTSFAKERGIGDCGVGSDYAWDGKQFRLAQQIVMDECRGSLDYITTWRAKVVR